MMQTLYLDILRFLPEGRLDLWGLLFLPASSSSSSLRSDKVSISMLSSPLLNPGLETNLSLSTIAAAKLKKNKNIYNKLLLFKILILIKTDVYLSILFFLASGSSSSLSVQSLSSLISKPNGLYVHLETKYQNPKLSKPNGLTDVLKFEVSIKNKLHIG